jgi:hypothetical protein
MRGTVPLEDTKGAPPKPQRGLLLQSNTQQRHSAIGMSAWGRGKSAASSFGQTGCYTYKLYLSKLPPPQQTSLYY